MEVMASGGASQVIQGSFSGTGTTISPNISCSFYPDIVIFYLDHDSTIDPAYTGLRWAVLLKDRFTGGVTDDNSGNITSSVLYSNDALRNASYSGLNEGGSGREERGNWDGQNFYLSTSPAASGLVYGRFVSGYTYNYILIKL